MYELFEHTADLGLRVRAPELDRLFEDAAAGLVSMILEDLPRPDTGVELYLAGDRHDYLLFDWLNELLYRFEAERLLFGQFEVHVGGDGLRARARGERVDPSTHRLLREVKAITYHGLRVEPVDDGWLAEVIVDI